MPSSGQPQITAIIPTFRRPALLRRAIQSVLEQDYRALRLYVYDNASGDETADVVAEFARADSRVSYHCHDHNIGGLANFQYGLSRVETPLFSLLSDDDYLLPGFYSAAVAGLERCKEAIFWAGLTLRFDSGGQFFDARLGSWEHDGIYSPPDGVLRMLHGDAPCWTGTLFRGTAIAEVGLLDEGVGGPADLDYMLRAAARHPYVVSLSPVAVFTMNPASVSAMAPLSMFWPGWLKIIQNIETIEELPGDARKQIVAALNADCARMLFRRGAEALAKSGYGFSGECAQVLRQHYRMVARSWLLRAISTACRQLPLAQRAYTAAYRAAERRIVSQRRAMAEKFQGYVRPL